MKKLFSLVALFLFLFILSACEKDTITIVVEGSRTRVEEEVSITGEETLFDILGATFAIGYQETDFGVMIERIGPLEAVHAGSFIFFEKNDEPAEAGVDAITPSPGDTYHFTLGWYDEEARMVHEAIERFVKHQADAYIDSPRREAILALAHLGELEGFDAPEDDPGDKDASGLIDAIVYRYAQGLSSEALVSALADRAELTGLHFTDALSSLVLCHPDEAYACGDFANDWLDTLSETDLAQMDPDTASMVLIALAHENMPQDGSERESALIGRLSETLYENEYGLDAAGFAMATLALLAQGIDPREETYIDQTHHPIDHLLSLQNEDGSFNHKQGDEDPDLLFSTPQAILALVMMQAYINGEETPNPYHLP